MRPSPLDASAIMELHRKTMTTMVESWLIVANSLGAVAARPELGDLAAGKWNTLRDSLTRDVYSENSVIRPQLGATLGR